MKFLFTILIVSFGVTGFSQSYNVNDFEPFSMPKAYSPVWYELATSKSPFLKVSVVDGKLQLNNYPYLTGAKEYKLREGKLLAFDVGEWGGGLYYMPNDSTNKVMVNGILVEANDKIKNYKIFFKGDSVINKIKNYRYLIHGGNTQFVIPYQNNYLFIQGLAHMGTNYGCVYNLHVQDNTFTISKMIDLDSEAAAMVMYKSKIYLTTYKGFWVIENGEAKQLFNELFWQGLGPASIAVANEKTIYVGLHGGYAKINPTTKELIFYKYNI